MRKHTKGNLNPQFKLSKRAKWTTIICMCVVGLIVIYALAIKPSIKQNRNEPENKGDQAANPPIIEIIHDDVVLDVYNHIEKKHVEMDMNEYLIGVLSAEVPASYEMEALKAQAVAARTLVYQKCFAAGGSGCQRYVGADVCTDYYSCQAWDDEDAQKKKWGGDFNKNRNSIIQAVNETSREIVTYEDKPIEAFFHSSSGGMTEPSEHVFSDAHPYYQYVESPGEEDEFKFYGEVRVGRKEFAETINKNYPEAKIKAGQLEEKMSITDRYKSGRIVSMKIGGAVVSGLELRTLFGLNSTNFTIKFTKTEVVFNTLGYGHGVGMSQSGAQIMAKAGKTYKEILEHYYVSTEVKKY